MSKYFRKIVGHQEQIARIREDFSKENLAHAYLLAGPSEIGKFTIARAMAKMLQTAGLPESEAAQMELQIERGYHPDVIVLNKKIDDKEELKAGKEKPKTGMKIGVEEIRKILTNLSLSAESRYRVLLIEEIERLTPEAANAMLKILEEPPSKVTFVFTASKPDQVLETILSRVRRIDFKRLSETEIRDELKRRFGLEETENIERATNLSAGRIGLGISLLENREVFEAYLNIYQEIESFLLNRDLVKGMAIVSQIHTDQLLTEVFVNVCLVVLRKMLLEAGSAGDWARQEELVKQLDFVLNLASQLETNVNSRLMLENLLLHI